MILENLVGDETCRKRGAGRLLRAELERIARAMDCPQILLIPETWREDEGSRRGPRAEATTHIPAPLLAPPLF